MLAEVTPVPAGLEPPDPFHSSGAGHNNSVSQQNLFACATVATIQLLFCRRNAHCLARLIPRVAEGCSCAAFRASFCKAATRSAGRARFCAAQTKLTLAARRPHYADVIATFARRWRISGADGSAGKDL